MLLGFWGIFPAPAASPPQCSRPEGGKKIVFKNNPHCKVSENATLGTSVVGRHRSQWNFPWNRRVQLLCPLIVKEKRSKMWNIHPKSGFCRFLCRFAQKTQPKVFPTSPGSFSSIEGSRGDFLVVNNGGQRSQKRNYPGHKIALPRVPVPTKSSFLVISGGSWRS